MRKRGNKSKRPTKETFFKLYDDENINVEEIARLFNVTKSTIYNWASQFKKEELSDKQILNRIKGYKKGKYA